MDTWRGSETPSKPHHELCFGWKCRKLFTHVFILLCMYACVCVCLFRCPWLAVAVCPAVPPCCAILFLFVLANFTMATFMDAGVLPMGKLPKWHYAYSGKYHYTWHNPTVYGRWTWRLHTLLMSPHTVLQLTRTRTKTMSSALRCTRTWTCGASRCGWSGAPRATSTDRRAARTAASVITVWRWVHGETSRSKGEVTGVFVLSPTGRRGRGGI